MPLDAYGSRGTPTVPPGCIPGSSQWNAKRIFRARNVIFYSANLIIIHLYHTKHTKRPSASPSPGRLARVPAIHLRCFVETKGGKETHVKQHTVIPRFQHQQPSDTKIQELQTVCPRFRHQSSIRNFIYLLENEHTKKNVAMARISLPLISISEDRGVSPRYMRQECQPTYGQWGLQPSHTWESMIASHR